jgi:hypothetical protein
VEYGYVVQVDTMASTAIVFYVASVVDWEQVAKTLANLDITLPRREGA